MILTDIKPKVIIIEDEDDAKYVGEIYNNNPRVGGILRSQDLTKRYYIVKPLDTISSIGEKLKINEEVLKQKLKTDRVFIGQKIEID